MLGRSLLNSVIMSPLVLTLDKFRMVVQIVVQQKNFRHQRLFFMLLSLDRIDSCTYRPTLHEISIRISIAATKLFSYPLLVQSVNFFAALT